MLKKLSRVIFLGTGNSSGIPLVSCLIKKDCKTCTDAMTKGSKNKRRNISLLIENKTEKDTKNIIIDVGKYFYQSAMDWFPIHDISKIDAVLITHEHFDAIGGFDDLRDFTNQTREEIPVYTRKKDFDSISKVYPYLVHKNVSNAGGRTAELKFNILKDSESIFDIFGLKIQPLEVFHGKNYTCLGFKFGNVVYISDVSLIPERIMTIIHNCDILVLDCLNLGKSHPSHFCFEESLENVLKIQPKSTYFIGMTHSIHHDTFNEYLKEWSLKNCRNVQLSFDGQILEVEL
jgi:phosphoribosyl 1,2-cyclic phosphodiesterase